MDDALILETTFLVDFERERVRAVSGPATRFLEGRGDQRLFITHTIAGELASGVSLSERGCWEAFIRPFRMLEPTADVDWAYGRTFRYLQGNGLLIGGNDLWIAATGLAYGVPVVTRNEAHYRRVPGLQVFGY